MMMETPELNNSLLGALQQTEEKYKAAVMYGAHLNALLREACDILDNLEVNVNVSEPLAFWWEREKRKRQAANSTLVSADGSAIGSGVGPDSGSDVDQLERAANESLASETQDRPVVVSLIQESQR